MMLRTEHFIWIVTSLLGIFVLVDAALKMQTAIEAKRFGIQKWWMILGISLIVMIVGISLITIPWKTEVLVTRLMGMTLGLHGVLNLWVVHNTVRIIRRKEI